MKTPIEKMLDSARWVEVQADRSGNPDLPYVTHQGILRILDMELKCYRLNDGRAIIDAEDFNKFFGM